LQSLAGKLTKPFEGQVRRRLYELQTRQSEAMGVVTKNWRLQQTEFLTCREKV
jgi:hypothetical protein